jgi:hypothetical protein
MTVENTEKQEPHRFSNGKEVRQEMIGMSEQVDLVPALQKSVELTSGLANFKSRVEAIVVRDQNGYIAACELVKEGRSYIKDVGFKLDPGINSAREHLEYLRSEKEKYIGPAKQIVAIAEKKGEEWKAEERRKAEEEQRRINEERRIAAEKQAAAERAEREKAAAEERKRREKEIEEQRKAGELKAREAQRLAREAREAEEREKQRAAQDAARMATEVKEVKVMPSVPKIAGIRARVNWKFRIVNANKIPREYLMPDEVKIGAAVRAAKQAGEVIPGIEAYSEDSI